MKAIPFLLALLLLAMGQAPAQGYRLLSGCNWHVAQTEMVAGDTTTCALSVERGDAHVSLPIALPPEAVRWTSSAPAVLRIDSTGHLHAARAGTATLRAEVLPAVALRASVRRQMQWVRDQMPFDEHEILREIRVLPPVQSVRWEVSPAHPVVGDTVFAQAVARGPDGSVVARRGGVITFRAQPPGGGESNLLARLPRFRLLGHSPEHIRLIGDEPATISLLARVGSLGDSVAITIAAKRRPTWKRLLRIP